jgi:hypothetical protein
LYIAFKKLASADAVLKRDFRPLLVERLRKTLKADIDKRVEEFLGGK